MILYFFYKNAVSATNCSPIDHYLIEFFDNSQTFVFLIFWYQLYCGFSGSVMIDEIYLMLYNLLFTSLPPLAIGVYDKTVAEDLLLLRPYLYRHVSVPQFMVSSANLKSLLALLYQHQSIRCLMLYIQVIRDNFNIEHTFCFTGPARISV